MFKANTFEDKELCDMLIEVEEAQQNSTFDLDNIHTIFKLGYYDTVRTLEEQYGLKRVLPPANLELPPVKSTAKRRRKIGVNLGFLDSSKKG